MELFDFKYYKSKTEERFPRIKSFSRTKNAKTRYMAKPNPAVTKVKYIKNKRTLEVRIPSLSAKREET